MAVVGDLRLAVRAGAGRDDRSIRPAADRRLAGRPQGRPLDGAGAGARALRARVPLEQVERAALRVDEDLADVFVRDADRRRLSARGLRRSRGVRVATAAAPQPATANAATTSAVAPARKVMDLCESCSLLSLDAGSWSRSEHAVAGRRSPLGVTGETPSRAPGPSRSAGRIPGHLAVAWPSQKHRYASADFGPSFSARVLSWWPMIRHLLGCR